MKGAHETRKSFDGEGNTRMIGMWLCLQLELPAHKLDQCLRIRTKKPHRLGLLGWMVEDDNALHGKVVEVNIRIVNPLLGQALFVETENSTTFISLHREVVNDLVGSVE